MYIPCGMAQDNPVGIRATSFGAIVTVVVEWMSYPIDPDVARDGRVASGDVNLNGTCSPNFSWCEVSRVVLYFDAETMDALKDPWSVDGVAH